MLDIYLSVLIKETRPIITKAAPNSILTICPNTDYRQISSKIFSWSHSWIFNVDIFYKKAGKSYNTPDPRNVNFPQIDGIRRGISEFLQIVYTKTLYMCYEFAAVLNLIFDYPFWGKGCPYKGSTLVLLGRAMVCSHRLSIHTVLSLYLALSDRNLWCKFWLGVVNPSLGQRDGRRGLKMGPLCSLMVTSYRFP